MNLLKAPCPCGHPECSAYGEPLARTGHSRGCWSGCVQCSRPKRQAPKRRIPEATRRQVLARAEARCEARFTSHCTGVAEHLHHRRRRSQGGADTAANLVACCRACHDAIHASPARAVAEGLLAPTTPEPNSSAVVKVERVER